MCFNAAYIKIHSLVDMPINNMCVYMCCLGYQWQMEGGEGNGDN